MPIKVIDGLLLVNFSLLQQIGQQSFFWEIVIYQILIPSSMPPYYTLLNFFNSVKSMHGPSIGSASTARCPNWTSAPRIVRPGPMVSFFSFLSLYFLYCWPDLIFRENHRPKYDYLARNVSYPKTFLRKSLCKIHHCAILIYFRKRFARKRKWVFAQLKHAYF